VCVCVQAYMCARASPRTSSSRVAHDHTFGDVAEPAKIRLQRLCNQQHTPVRLHAMWFKLTKRA